MEFGSNVEFEVLASIWISMVVFWVVVQSIISKVNGSSFVFNTNESIKFCQKSRLKQKRAKNNALHLVNSMEK